jgi:hypothetical protein
LYYLFQYCFAVVALATTYAVKVREMHLKNREDQGEEELLASRDVELFKHSHLLVEKVEAHHPSYSEDKEVPTPQVVVAKVLDHLSSNRVANSIMLIFLATRSLRPEEATTSRREDSMHQAKNHPVSRDPNPC